MNLGMSESFGDIDTSRLQFPAVMEVDYVRVYQKKGKINVGCDPVGFPTAEYIERCIFYI
jgi:beta-glucanase (GH16 family)